MWGTIRRAILLAALCATLISAASAEPPSVTTFKGKFSDGATYLIKVPSKWNGTLVLYSHGYVVPGSKNPAEDVGDPITGSYLLSDGYALAGSSYATTGWAIQQAIPDQIAVLDKFRSLVAQPKHTIAWGHSLGGMVTAGLIQRYPKRFDAALPMCGVVGGGVGTWNQALDSAFAFYILLAKGSGLQLVNITDPVNNYLLADKLLTKAQKTAQGQARIALSAALDDTPGWFDPLKREPSSKNYVAQEANQYDWLSQVDFPFAFALRAELEGRAEGNPSWNNGVDYRKQLQASANLAEVKALYQKAGLNLDADLNDLANAKRIEARKSSLDYLKRNIIFDGNLAVPVLTMHTKGDGLVAVEEESAYKDVVDHAGKGELLREIFVHRAGHCEFTPAETVVAFTALTYRLDQGTWPDLDASALNTAAKDLGSSFNVLLVNGNKVHADPAYFKYTPPVFLRPYSKGKR